MGEYTGVTITFALEYNYGRVVKDERTKALGKELKDKMNAIFFGGSDGGTDESTDGDKAVSDDMGMLLLRRYRFEMP